MTDHAGQAATEVVTHGMFYVNGKQATFDDLWACWAVHNLTGTDAEPWAVTSRTDCHELECDGPHANLTLDAPQETAHAKPNHTVYCYGQQAHDGDACRDCDWQGTHAQGDKHAPRAT